MSSADYVVDVIKNSSGNLEISMNPANDSIKILLQNSGIFNIIKQDVATTYKQVDLNGRVYNAPVYVMKTQNLSPVYKMNTNIGIISVQLNYQL